MKVLVLIDRRNWAYHAIAIALEKYNHMSDLHMDIDHIKSNENVIKKKWKKYDRVFVMGWQTYEKVSFIDKKITLTGIHSFHSWDNKKTTPEKDTSPPADLIEKLSSFMRVNAVSERLTKLFKKHGLKNIFYTPNGVDTSLFVNTLHPPLSDVLTVGYSGTQSHDWRKGISEFILPSAKKANVQCKLAMLNTEKYVPLSEMYKFYNNIDCYICASLSEGMSLSVLEAASCGRPIITTRVSGCTEIIKDGITGYFVDRNVSDIAGKIEQLKDRYVLSKMSKSIEQDIKLNWGWNTISKHWINFIYQSI